MLHSTSAEKSAASSTNSLCARCYTSDTVPFQNAWFLLLSFKTSDSVDEAEFLLRQKLTHKVATASKHRVEGTHCGTGADQVTIEKTADSLKYGFASDGLRFLNYLFEAVLQQSRLSSDIIKGRASFDPLILFKHPTEVALRHFDHLLTTFQLRSWITEDNESKYREEYLLLIDHLGATYPPDFYMDDASPYLISFMMELEFLQGLEHFLHLFKLCCLCITTGSPNHPVVIMGDCGASITCGRFTDVILPGQSYLAVVTNSVAYCCNENGMAKISLLSADFGRSAFDDA